MEIHPIRPLDETEDAPEFERIQTNTQVPYDNARFFTKMRRRLVEIHKTKRIPASVLAVFILYHTMCDKNTGRFYRDDPTLVKTTGMSKSTIYEAFDLAVEMGLIQHVDGKEYVIAHYEEDRTDEAYLSYFRLTNGLIRALPKMVAHHNGSIILLALEILDCSRSLKKEIVRKITTLRWKKMIGSNRKRVLAALELLEGVATWAIYPNSTGTDDLVQFWLIQTNERDEEQNRLRALHGEVSRETKERFDNQINYMRRSRFFKEEDIPVVNPEELSWRSLSRTTRRIIQFGLEHNLTDLEIKELARAWGAYLARYNIKNTVGYLVKLLKNGDLLKNSKMYTIPGIPTTVSA